MGSREYGIDFSPGGLGPRGGDKAPIRILGRNEDCPVGGSTRCRDRGWIRSRQGLPPDPGPSVAAVPKALDLEPAPPKHAQGPVPGRGRCQGRPVHAAGGQAAQAGLLHAGAVGQNPEGGHGQDRPVPVPAVWIRAARARPRPAHAPGVRRPCSTGPASRRCRGPRPGWRRGARPRAPWGACSGRGTTGAVPAGLAGLAVRPRRLRPSAMGRMALLADMRTQVRGPGVHILLHRIEPLAQIPVRQPLAVGAGLGEPGVPERGPRPVAGYACKPAVLQAQRGLPVRRAGHRPRPHRVHDAQYGAAYGGNPRRRQGRGPRDRRMPADTVPTVVGDELNTKAGTASAKGTGAAPGRNLKRKAGRHRSLPARGGRGPERKPDPKAGESVTVNPAPTSQTGSRCGSVRRTCRPSQTLFVCGLRVPGQRRPTGG